MDINELKKKTEEILQNFSKDVRDEIEKMVKEYSESLPHLEPELREEAIESFRYEIAVEFDQILNPKNGHEAQKKIREQEEEAAEKYQQELEEWILSGGEKSATKPTGFEGRANDGEYIDVYYGTNRKKIGTEKGISKFANEMDEKDQVHLGMLKVFIPAQKPKASTQGMTVSKERVLEKEGEFWSLVQSALKVASKNSILLFIHGFYNTFNDAAIRCAQLAHDTNYQGVASFFSWPSSYSMAKNGYQEDQKRSKASAKHVRKFIDDLVNLDTKEVIIVAHSMGNWTLYNALKVSKLQNVHKKLHFVMAAADLSLYDYKESFTEYYASASGRTAYTNYYDKALWASKVENKDKLTRLGLLFGPVDDTDVIDTMQNRIYFGHSYISEDDRVLKDLALLLEGKKEAKDRNKETIIKSDKTKIYHVKA